MLNKITIFVLSAISILNIPIALSDEISRPAKKSEKAIFEEIRWLQAEAMVTIATKHEISISRAPSIVTVITDEEIERMGYLTLVEVLKTVPGFAILKGESFGEVFPEVRGVTGSARIRVMVDGHHVNTPLSSAAFLIFDDFPVENIKRIEIIRGPGAAVYGENALLSVINIITYDADDIDGIKITNGYGRFDTYDGNIVFGKVYGEFSISGMARYRETNGFDGIVDSDSQTALDSSLSPFGFIPASNAPGRVDDGRREYDLNLKLNYKDFYAEGLYINKSQGPFVGPGLALTEGSDVQNNYVFIEAGYNKTFKDRFTVRPRVYYDQFDSNNFIKAFPDGSTFSPGLALSGAPAGFVTYPNGFIGDGRVSEKVVGTEIPLDYELFDGNTLTIGTEFRLVQQTNVRFQTNFNPVSLLALSSIKDFSDEFPFLKETTRRIWSFYAQDIWDITKNVNFTLGFRFDQYTGFGGEISPRAALSWEFMENATLRLLYGKAFRPPSFTELFTSNQPALLGNENLDPEILHSYEIGLSYRFNKNITSSINYFYNDHDNLITLNAVPGKITARYENFGDAHIQGVEVESKIDFGDKVNTFMNYTFLDAQDSFGNNMPFVSKHKGNFGVNVEYPKYINTNLNAFVSGKRYRQAGDSRNDNGMPSYAVFNLSVIGKNFFNTMKIQGTIFNLLDKDYSDPGATSIPDDLPRPGRTFFIGLSYQF